MKVIVEVLTGSDPSDLHPDLTSTIVANGSPAPDCVTITADPDDPRAVILTPGTVAAPQVLCFVTSSPSAQDNLQLDVEVTAVSSFRRIGYVSHSYIV